jgi:hypothetical protein
MPVVTSPSAYSAIPPLSEQQLQGRAMHIVIGQVTSIKTKEVAVQYGTNYEHIATVQIETVEKSRSTPLKSRQMINVHYTTLKNRQSGWTGSQRQSRPLETGAKVKLFLVEKEPMLFYLLEPNGWQAQSSKPESALPQPAIDEQLTRSGFDPQATRSFITQIRTAAARRDAKKLVSLVRFPLTLYEVGKPLITYHQPEALMRDFSLVFTDPVLQDLQQARDVNLFVNGNGAMIGNGAIWFDQRQDGIKIKAINGDREPLKANF